MSTATSHRCSVIKNNATVALRDIPVLEYSAFYPAVLEQLKTEGNHCVNYYAFRTENKLKFLCCVADDRQGDIRVFSHEMPEEKRSQLLSLTAEFYPMHVFEREIAENFDVEFLHHPWPKPVRYAFDRADKSKVINQYPFYKIESEELHEVGVGPIHAGVIEPGHFRFLCNGETVLHLEIQLGWQHRGVESLFLHKPSLIQRTILSESIAGDTAVAHSLAFVTLMENLGNVNSNARLDLERTLALELERIAMHVGDLGNVNIGFAYQLAASVFGTLRTPVINYTQTWCGNRFGKGLNRVGGTHYPFTDELAAKLAALLDKFEASFIPMADRLFSLPSALMRAEGIGKVTQKQMELIGAVGMAARNAGLMRDIRKSHPFVSYTEHPIPSRTVDEGDVQARLMLRNLEVRDSIAYTRELMKLITAEKDLPPQPLAENKLHLQPGAFSIALVEGWRGEICHCAVTDNAGAIRHYKVKDPSLHNWMALALSLRDLEISDFPINNKSYNLSYCGHDL